MDKEGFFNCISNESVNTESVIDWIFVPSPVADKSVCCSDLSFLKYSTGERNISEDFIFSPGPRF